MTDPTPRKAEDRPTPSKLLQFFRGSAPQRLQTQVAMFNLMPPSARMELLLFLVLSSNEDHERLTNMVLQLGQAHNGLAAAFSATQPQDEEPLNAPQS